MNCYQCNSELSWGGDHDCEDVDEYAVVTNLSCPKCGSFVLTYHLQDSKMITKEDIDAFKDMQEPPAQVGLHEMPKDWDHPHPTALQMVTAFAERMDQPLNQPWAKDVELEEFRWNLIQEEYNEASEESSNRNDPENMFKECLDMLVVIIGYCATYGWDVDEGFRRVHASNMSKLGLDGKPLKNSSGKVLKGPNYKPAILTDLVETNNEQ